MASTPQPLLPPVTTIETTRVSEVVSRARPGAFDPGDPRAALLAVTDSLRTGTPASSRATPGRRRASDSRGKTVY